VLLGNYNGEPSHAVTPLEGIRKRAGESIGVKYAKGCELIGGSMEGFAEAVETARSCDAIIAVMGLSSCLEGEEGEVNLIDKSGDRVDIDLPGVQEALLKQLHATGKPLIVVLLSGSAVAVSWAHENAAALLATWYGGEEAGTALAEVLFGDYNPAGRLPVTFYKSLSQVPPFEQYAMAGRTYRFFKEEPLYGFGYGLSYTLFAYRNLRLSAESITAGASLRVSVDVSNLGARAGDEVVQLYVTDKSASVPVPIRQLQGFRRVHLSAGETVTVEFDIAPEQMMCYADDGTAMLEAGWFEASVGGGQPPAPNCVTAQFEVVGG